MTRIEDCNGTEPLFAQGAGDGWLQWNPETSIYDTRHKRVAFSSFTYLTADFEADDAEADATSYSVRRFKGDLLGECFIDFNVELEEEGQVPDYDLIESCAFQGATETMNGIAESLTGKTMRVLAKFSPKYELLHTRMQGGRNKFHVTFPVPFFFCHSTEDYFPLVSTANQTKSIACKLTKRVSDLHLVYKAVFLDDGHALDNEKLLCLTKTATVRVPRDACEIDMDGFLCGLDGAGLNDAGAVKDIQVMIEPSTNDDDNDKRPAAAAAAVELVNCFFNQKCHMSLNAHLLAHVARTMYNRTRGVEAEEDGTSFLCLPFCHDPMGARHAHTSHVKANRLASFKLEIKFSSGDPPGGHYDVTVVARKYNKAMFKGGICGHAFSH